MVLLESVSKIYRTRQGQVKALDRVSLQVHQSEFLVVRGRSGSGKTTLLLTIGGMLRPTNGRVTVGGSDISSMSERDRAKFRAENIGFVFQMFHLVPYLSTMENILLATQSRGSADAKGRASELLQRLNLLDRAQHRPSQLSAGERQRTAIARALLNSPNIILADEPTGNLDPETAHEVIGYLSEFHKAGGTVIVVTHGEIADKHADRIIYLQSGAIQESLTDQ
ncbi:MAG: ABC transporter ATP-binding protein [bacterium]